MRFSSLICLVPFIGAALAAPAPIIQAKGSTEVRRASVERRVDLDSILSDLSAKVTTLVPATSTVFTTVDEVKATVDPLTKDIVTAAKATLTGRKRSLAEEKRRVIPRSSFHTSADMLSRALSQRDNELATLLADVLASVDSVIRSIDPSLADLVSDELASLDKALATLIKSIQTIDGELTDAALQILADLGIDTSFLDPVLDIVNKLGADIFSLLLSLVGQ